MTNEQAREIIIEEQDSLKANPMVKVEDCLYEALDMAIKALESQRWIPVSEKPQEGRYLCTYEHCDGKCIDFGSFDGDVWYIKPIAYMPLPELYKIPAQTFGCAED